MARGVSFQIKGVPGLEQALGDVSKHIRQTVGDATKTTAHLVVSRAQSLAPVDEGALRDNIAVRGSGIRYRVGILDTAIPGRGKNTAHQHPWAYGLWYEFGFRTRNIPSHPFMGPAVDSQEQPHIERVRDALNEAIP